MSGSAPLPEVAQARPEWQHRAVLSDNGFEARQQRRCAELLGPTYAVTESNLHAMHRAHSTSDSPFFADRIVEGTKIVLTFRPMALKVREFSEAHPRVAPKSVVHQSDAFDKMLQFDRVNGCSPSLAVRRSSLLPILFAF